MRWAVMVHGGAGDWARADEAGALAGVSAAAACAARLLAAGARARDAVVAAVSVLEDDLLFNAGTGSVLNRDGEVEMDASVMDGERLACGAVAAIRRVRHPVQVALQVMEHTGHVMLAGDGATAFARRRGFQDYDPITQRMQQRWRTRASARPPGTVGAVALDSRCNMAAATSTGGVMLKLPGRVGDSPIPGAGNYATGSAACSATGQGELMMRVLAAKSLCDRVSAGMSPQRAVDEQLSEMRRGVGSDCGFILLGRAGMGAGHDTASMPHAWQVEGDAEVFARMRVAGKGTGRS